LTFGRLVVAAMSEFFYVLVSFHPEFAAGNPRERTAVYENPLPTISMFRVHKVAGQNARLI